MEDATEDSLLRIAKLDWRSALYLSMIDLTNATRWFMMLVSCFLCNALRSWFYCGLEPCLPFGSQLFSPHIIFIDIRLANLAEFRMFRQRDVC